MKKFISTIAALGVVAAMGASAMAADLPSVTTTADITGTTVSLNPDYYNVEVYEIDFELPAIITDELQETVAETVGDKEVAAIDLCGLKITNKETGMNLDYYIDDDNPVTIAFAFDDAENVIGVFQWSMEGEEIWESVDFEIVDGQIVVTLDEAFVIAFATQPVKADEPAKENGKSSAQTGYDTFIYIASAVALAVGAVFFFATSGKKARNSK